MFGLDPSLTILLILCLLAAAAFEFINGFHDTANAVATVIYTNALKPWVAVTWSGIWNALGVFAGGIAVAMGITNLLPAEVLLDTNIYHNLALIFSLLITAISWNLATWYFGIPCSSSHSLIGSIIGVGLAYSFFTGTPGHYVNWQKATDIGLSLLFSPIIGFSIAILFMYILRQAVKGRYIFRQPTSNVPPPFWLRLVLLLTCTGVSFSHGSNDGQKGVGLVMLILIAIVPGYFTLDLSCSGNHMRQLNSEAIVILHKVDSNELNREEQFELSKSLQLTNDISRLLPAGRELAQCSNEEKQQLRHSLVLLSRSSRNLLESANINLSTANRAKLKKSVAGLRKVNEFAPGWVILMISLSLGIGTMEGWKRIVTTIGEKIGRQHLTYAQGASAEVVAACTIGLSTWLGLPVSTTHVLSSGIAGSMVASRGIKNLQTRTIKNIALAWLLTLPFCILVSGCLFFLFRSIL